MPQGKCVSCEHGGPLFWHTAGVKALYSTTALTSRPVQQDPDQEALRPGPQESGKMTIDVIFKDQTRMRIKR